MSQGRLKQKIFFSSLILIITCSGLVQCSKKEDSSSKIQYLTVPEKPIVINSSFTVNLEDGDGNPDTFKTLSIKAPWFLFGYSIKNNSDKTITIVNLKFHIVGKKKGVPTVVEKSLDLSTLGKDVNHLEEIAPGASASTYTNTRFYIDDLPSDVDNFSYSVQVEVQGWIGTFKNPEQRLNSNWSFITE